MVSEGILFISSSYLAEWDPIFARLSCVSFVRRAGRIRVSSVASRTSPLYRIFTAVHTLTQIVLNISSFFELNSNFLDFLTEILPIDQNRNRVFRQFCVHVDVFCDEPVPVVTNTHDPP